MFAPFYFLIAYTRGLKHAARGPHAALKAILCGPQQLTQNAKILRVLCYRTPQFSLFSTQFTVDAESVPVELQMEVVDLQCDTILKQKYTEIGIPNFYKFLSRANVPKLVNAAARIMSMFGST